MYPDNQVYKYIDQLERRVLEQEQLIALLNEKILSLKSTPQVNQPNAADVRSPTSCNVPPRDQNMDQMSFVGTRKSDVPSVTTTKYNQYFVSRVGPDTTIFSFPFASEPSVFFSQSFSVSKTRNESCVRNNAWLSVNHLGTFTRSYCGTSGFLVHLNNLHTTRVAGEPRGEVHPRYIQIPVTGSSPRVVEVLELPTSEVTGQ
ncbi:hypothetical protein M8J75_014251 [Diaphorina citri]|nr:hypothetical protein M8J75_014251 [Diaphorina citri]